MKRGRKEGKKMSVKGGKRENELDQEAGFI